MIRRELSIFLVVGLLTVAVDFTTYRGLLWAIGSEVELAKASGFIAGTLFAYFANRAWTFGHKEHAPGSVWRFALVYTATLGANVGVNSVALKVFADRNSAIQIAFVIATGVSATLNFLGMKLFAFKSNPSSGLA